MFLFPLLIMVHFASAAAINPATIKFDHSRTGFPLTGAHILVRCASCHVNGVFKGTPHDCASCHVAGNRMGAVFKNTTHIPTFNKCDKCHQVNAWTPVKRFDHLGVAPGSCQNCHNGIGTTGKPSGHIATTASCDSCHKTVDWKQLASGGLMPANHLPTTQACSLCHNQSSFIPGVMSHTGIFGGCASCHNGQSFVGVTPMKMPTTHLPTSMPCETCHSVSKTSPGGFVGTLMSHTGIFTNCALCHNGQSFFGIGVPKQKSNFAGHIVTSSDCSICHSSTTSFLIANGNAVPIGHLPTTQPCTTCHTAGFGAGSGLMTHTGILSGCASCHNGQVFTGVAPKSKPVNHLPTSMPCEICHSNINFASFSGTTMKHTGIFGGCTNCHNGQAFAGITPMSKPTNHLQTSMSCETCHTTANTNAGGFAGGTMSHVGIVSGCASCHSGQITFAGAGLMAMPVSKPVTHLATSSPCETCHTSTTSFKVAIGGSKPANHLPTTAACSICHSTASYYPGIMNHTGAGIISGCSTCHNGQVFAGVTPVSKPVNHLPTSMPCESCHTTSNTSPGGFSGGKMNHTGIVSGCTNCHNGQAFSGIMPVSKSSKHIPYATTLIGGAGMQCEFCHSTSVFTSFMTGTVSSTTMHNGTTGGGACYTCHVSPNQWSATNMQTKNHKSTSLSKDCSSSGCHRPLGNKGTSYTSWK